MLEENVYKQDPEEFLNNDNAYINNLRNSTKKIKLFDVSSKTEKEIYQDIYQNIEDIQYENGKVYFIAHKGRKIEYIDLETKESKQLKLFDKNGYLVEILAENKEFYFVRKGYELGAEYTTWAGTKQQNIERINYALMKKEDYWSSKPKYIDIKNT